MATRRGAQKDMSSTGERAAWRCRCWPAFGRLRFFSTPWRLWPISETTQTTPGSSVSIREVGGRRRAALCCREFGWARLLKVCKLDSLELLGWTGNGLLNFFEGEPKSCVWASKSPCHKLICRVELSMFVPGTNSWGVIGAATTATSDITMGAVSLAVWEVVRIQQSRFCEFPAFKNFPWDEWDIKCIHFLRRCQKSDKKVVFRAP